jgi:predicted GTPase
MGAAGRDFHNFNVYFRNNPLYHVEAFTAFQIPGIAGRTYPPELAGRLYPAGIPIFDEAELLDLICRHRVDEVVFAYSDVAHVEVMHRASLVNAAGAEFRLLGASSTMIESTKPVVSVCAVRTGCGKSPTSRAITGLLRQRGRRVAVVRHPMPYGQDLNAQRCQRFEVVEDLDRHHCTIEEREEYESHIGNGNVVYAGVDYEEILRRAETEADVILWDGGNNDLPFYRPDLHIVLVDPHRPGHELLYHPGETNLRMAQVVMVSKIGTARPDAIAQVEASSRLLNPAAKLIRADSVVSVEDQEAIRGRRVLVVEDGPTLTHGEMKYGAAHHAAQKFGAAEIVDPRAFAVGSIRATFEKYRHLVDVLPAMGYGEEQIHDLSETINAVPCDLVLVGTPFDLSRLVRTGRRMLRVSYNLDASATRDLDAVLNEYLPGLSAGR